MRRATAALAAAVLALAGCTSQASTEGKAGSPDRPSASGSTRARPSPSPSPEPWRPRSIAALGDSITRGFHACGALRDCPSASWSTGTAGQVDSLARRLLPDPAGKTWNFARSGAQVEQLPVQTDQAIGRRPDLVTILIGANDACTASSAQMTPVEDFRVAVDASLDRLERTLPRTRVYVSSVPSLLRLWEVGHGSPVTRQIWNLGICQSMLGDAGSQDAAATDRRGRVQERVREYNAVLEEECAEHPRCLYDGGAAFAYDFTRDHLSRWDFFHPDKQGQHALADIAYQRLKKEVTG